MEETLQHSQVCSCSITMLQQRCSTAVIRRGLNNTTLVPRITCARYHVYRVQVYTDAVSCWPLNLGCLIHWLITQSSFKYLIYGKLLYTNLLNTASNTGTVKYMLIPHIKCHLFNSYARRIAPRAITIDELGLYLIPALSMPVVEANRRCR